MKEISAEEFTNFVTKDPNWASKLTSPISIKGEVNLKEHHISQLSVYLHFQEVASFQNCPNLKTATGTFHQGVSFSSSSIEKIEDLHITQPDETGLAASFWNCKNLKIATGKFAGCVYFSRSGIERIQNLEVTQPNNNGWATSFRDCKNLKRVTGEYPGKVNFKDSPNITKAPAWILDPKKAINLPDKVLKRIQKLLQKPPEIDLPI